MPHDAHVYLAEEVTIQEGAIVSKVIHRDDVLNVTVFGFDTGQALTEHRSPRHAIIEVVSGRIEIIVDNHNFDALAGFWLHLDPETSHSLVAAEPSIVLLTLA